MARSNLDLQNNQIIKDNFRSGAVLVRGILEILTLGVTVGTCLALNDVMADIFRIFNEIFGQSGFMIPENMVLNSLLPTMVVSAIPMLLTAAAYFIIFGKSRSSAPDAKPDAGFIILNIFAIIELICTVITAVVGIAAAGILLIKMPESMRKNSKIWMALLIGVIVMCAVILIIAIVYKLYIGSIRKTAKTGELRNTGAKAYGVFSVLSAICSVFSILLSLGLVLLHNKVYQLVRDMFFADAPEELGSFFADSGTWIFLFMLLSAVITFIIHIVDAKIALGYNRRIKDARINGISGDAGDPPAGDGFYRSDATERPKKKKGYGDRFIED